VCFCSIFIDVALRVDCILSLGTLFVLISNCTVMAECDRILEGPAHYIASLTVPATGYC